MSLKAIVAGIAVALLIWLFHQPFKRLESKMPELRVFVGPCRAAFLTVGAVALLMGEHSVAINNAILAGAVTFSTVFRAVVFNEWPSKEQAK